MSILGVGVDIVNVERVKKNYSSSGDAFARRILSDLEFVTYEKQSDKALYLAKCFAVKEAVAKSLGTGFSGDVYLTKISYQKLDSGQPDVILHDSTKEYARSVGVTRIHLSISDDHPNIVAFAVLEK